MTGKAVPSVQIDNERTRVTEWRFTPGAATGFHRHEYDYVIVPGTTGTPTRMATSRAVTLSPMSWMDSADGPMKVMPDS